MILETAALLATAGNAIAQRSAARKQRRHQKRAMRHYETDIKAKQAHLGDIHRRQDLAFGDSNIGLEGGVLDDRRANLERDQKFSADEIARRLALARGSRKNLDSISALENAQSTAGIIGSGAMALDALLPKASLGDDVQSAMGGLPELPGVSPTGLLSQLTQMLYKKRNP